MNIFRGEPELEEAFDELSLRLKDVESKGIILNVDSWFDISKGKTSSNYKRTDFDAKM